MSIGEPNNVVPWPSAGPDMDDEVLDRQEHYKHEAQAGAHFQDADLTRRWAEEDPEGNDYEPLIEGILGKGKIAVMVGSPGVGKTFVALHLSDCVARGIPFFGRQTARSPVYYMAMEDGGDEFQWRCDAIMKVRAGVHLHRRMRVLYGEEINLGIKANDARRIIDAMKKDTTEIGEPFGLVVVDTLSMVMPGADENSSAPMTRLVANMKTIAHETGAAVLILHHPSSNDQNRPRGHSSLLGATSTVIAVKREGPGNQQLSIDVTKNRNGPNATFRALLRQVQLNKRISSGQPITSLVVDEMLDEGTGATEGGGARLTPRTEQAYAVLYNMATKLTADGDLPPGCIKKATFTAELKRQGVIRSDAKDPDRTVREIVGSLNRAGLTSEQTGANGPFLWLRNDPKSDVNPCAPEEALPPPELQSDRSKGGGIENPIKSMDGGTGGKAEEDLAPPPGTSGGASRSPPLGGPALPSAPAQPQSEVKESGMPGGSLGRGPNQEDDDLW